jgi:hypothetical protein
MYADLGVSSVLVIGGSGGTTPVCTTLRRPFTVLTNHNHPSRHGSDYFDVADTVIMMQSYVPQYGPTCPQAAPHFSCFL